MSEKQTLLKQLAQDDLKGVLKGLYLLGKQQDNTQILNDVTFQSGRLKALERKRRIDTISLENDHLETAKIRQALLQIVNDLPNDWKAEGIETVSTALPTISKIKWKKYVIIFASAIALLAGIVEFSGYLKESTEQPAIIQPPSQKSSTSGDNSPAIITGDGDVNINYGEPSIKKDSTAKK